MNVIIARAYAQCFGVRLPAQSTRETCVVTERFHRRDVGHIDLEVTLDDPKAYTRSWALPVELDLIPDQELIEYVCENERDSRHLVGKTGEEFRVPADAPAAYVCAYGSPASPADIVVSLDGSRLTCKRRSQC